MREQSRDSSENRAPDRQSGRIAMLRTRASTLVIAAALAVMSTKARAGAWTQPAGHGQVILTSFLYTTTETFGPGLTIQKFQYGGRFSQLMTSAFVEIGTTRHSSVVFNVPGYFLDYQNAYADTSSAEFGDIEVAWKQRLNRPTSRAAVSAQVSFSAPAYSENDNPAPGNHQHDIEGRFLLGRGGEGRREHWFWDAEAGYRYRTGAPADQVRTDLTMGIEFAHRLMPMIQAFAIKGMRNGQPITANSNPNTQSDFDLYKGQASVVVRVSPKTSLQVGWNDAFAGRNTGNGQTALVGIWRSF